MNVLCLVAHADDEALFCGGLLAAVCKTNCGLTRIVAWKSPAECNAITDNPEREVARQCNRITAFGRSCAKVSQLQPFFSLTGWGAFGLGVTITHGATGEYGHPDHIELHRLTESHPLPKVHFATESTGTHRILVDWSIKQAMLDCYRYGCTRTREWNPHDNPAYLPWLGEYEYYTADSAASAIMTEILGGEWETHNAMNG